MTVVNDAAATAPVVLVDPDTGELQTLPLATPRAGASAPAGPRVHFQIPVMVRSSLVWLGVCWFSIQTVLACVLGLWLGDARMPGLAVVSLAASACYWWYLRHPAGFYEPATNSYLKVWPFGLCWRRRPARAGRTLALRGQRIVETGRPHRTVLRAVWMRPGEWAAIARSVRAAPDQPSRTTPATSRPAFITRRHRAIGTVVVLTAAAGLFHLAAQTLIAHLEHEPQQTRAHATVHVAPTAEGGHRAAGDAPPGAHETCSRLQRVRGAHASDPTGAGPSTYGAHRGAPARTDCRCP